MKSDPPGIRPSLLDRLIDTEPERTREAVQHRLISVGKAEAQVARDVEMLLNTKGPAFPPLPAYREVNNSLYTYGLADFTSHSPKNSAVRQSLRQEIERAIFRFEPRLKQVTVRIETESTNEQTIRFKITGLLVVDPVREPIMFDTFLDISSCEYVVNK
jgi:type VI secretion system protein ImpF